MLSDPERFGATAGSATAVTAKGRGLLAPGWQRCAMATVNAQSTLSQRYSQRYSQRSLMCTKTYHFAQTRYLDLKK